MLEGTGDRFVVDEVVRFQHMTEMLYGLVDCQHLAVIYTVFLLLACLRSTFLYFVASRRANQWPLELPWSTLNSMWVAPTL
jgi:hypothetical protein